MKHILATACGGLILATASGCISQQIIERTYYEPTKDTLTKRADGLVCGAVKSEITKSGSRDEGKKSYTVGLVNVND